MVVHRALVVLVLGGLILGGPGRGLAQEQDLCAPFKEDGKVDPSMIERMLDAAETGHLYRIQPASSRVGFCVESRFSRVKAEFQEFQGGLTLWSDKSAGSEEAMVVIQAASLDTDGSMIEQMLKSERFFDVKKYPEILFVSTGITWTGRDSARLQGDLTLHGATRSVVFNVQLSRIINGDDDRIEKVRVKATASISRSDFGMDTLSQLVDDSVELCMSVEAVRYKG